MANENQTNIKLERSYNIPLRRTFQRAPSYKRTNRAVKGVKEFLQRHMKSDNVKLGKYLNLKLWERGIRNPPHHIKVNAIKDDKGVVRAELVGKEIELEKPKEKKEEGMAEKLGIKKEEETPEKNTYKPKTEEDSKSGEEETAQETPQEEKAQKTDSVDEKESQTQQDKETTETEKNKESQPASENGSDDTAKDSPKQDNTKQETK